MSIVDDADGVAYTLNLVRNELRRSSDGMVLTLTSQQAADAATAFASTEYNDPSIPQLENLEYVPPTTGCTGMPDNPCDARAARPVPEISSAGFLMRRSDGGQVVPAVEQPGAPGSGTLKSVKRGKQKAMMAPNGLVTVASYDKCTDIINAALPRTIDYRGKRASWLKRGFDFAATAVINNVLTWVVPGGSESVEFSTGAANSVMAGISIGFLRANWNDYNCSTSTVVAGPYYYQNHTYSQTPTGLRYVCHEETWEISWDGGDTWEPIRVSVCQFEA